MTPLSPEAFDRLVVDNGTDVEAQEMFGLMFTRVGGVEYVTTMAEQPTEVPC